MAKDVVFESEKYMKRQEAKRKWIPILCIAAVLLLVVVIALIIRGSRGVVYSGGEDTPYPYSWSVNRKGELTLNIASPEGYTWKTSDVDYRGLDLARPEKQAEGASTFTITPLAPGRYVSVFSLVNREDAEDAIYEWRFLMDSAETGEGDASSAGPLSILSGSGMERAGKTRSGEEDALPYTIQTDGDGNLILEIVNPAAGTYQEASYTPVAADRDEGDVVSEQTQGEEDGAQAPTAPQPLESTVISDPAEIEELVGMPYDEWVAMMQAEAEANAAETTYYDTNWTASSDNENAAVPAGIFYTGEMAIATFNAGETDGTANVLVTNNILGLEIHAAVENKDGVLSVKEYGSRSFEPAVTMAPETVPEPVEGTAEPETAPEP